MIAFEGVLLLKRVKKAFRAAVVDAVVVGVAALKMGSRCLLKLSSRQMQDWLSWPALRGGQLQLRVSLGAIAMLEAVSVAQAAGDGRRRRLSSI